MEAIKNKFYELGYKFCKETKTYIEFKTDEYGTYDKIRIDKRDFEIMTNCRTGAGNTGHRNLTYKEFLLIGELFKTLKDKR